MKLLFRSLAIAIVALVGLQAAAHAWGSAGLGLFIEGGGVADSSLMSSATPPFPEVVGFMIHGINGMMVIPSVALVLLVVSFFTRLRGAVMWAAITLGLVALQVTLGMLGHGLPALGFLHGLNALVLAAAALYTQSLAKRSGTEVPVVERTAAGTPAHA